MSSQITIHELNSIVLVSYLKEERTLTKKTAVKIENDQLLEKFKAKLLVFTT